MLAQVKGLWGGYIRPLYQRPERVQLAALCYRGCGSDTEVLLITSRDTGRWVVPKGWPMVGRDSAGTALQEAWEEAGVWRAQSARHPIGGYLYNKRLKEDWAVPVRVWVYPAQVQELRDDFPEASERSRVWVSPAEAARRVDEPGLRDLLMGFRGKSPDKRRGAN